MTDPSGIPWELLGGGGAALAVLIAVLINQRHVKDVVTTQADATKAMAQEFAATVKDANQKSKCLAETFTETVTDLSREGRESHEKCQQALQDILRAQIPKRE